MNCKQKLNGFFSIIIVAIALPLGAIAGTEEKHELRIAIDDGSPDGQLSIDLDDQSGVNLHDLQVGESQSVVDEQGRAVLVTRTEHGLTLSVDGRVIELPDIAADFDLQVFDPGADIEFEKELVILGAAGTAARDGITIISGQPIDDATREGIRSVLLSAGHSADVSFLDGSAARTGPDGAEHAVGHRQIRVISQEVNATN